MKHLILFLFLLGLQGIRAKAQDHTILIHSEGRVASLQMTSTEYRNWIDNDEYNNATVRKALVKDIYKKFKDEFDFIFLVLNESEKPDNLPYGQLIQVSNAVHGIGLGLFDHSQEYGSSGRLKALLHLTRLDYLRHGPSLHELMHNWGNFGVPVETVNKFGTGLTSFSCKPHWGFTGGSTKGQLGGFKQSTLVNNGGRDYTVEAFGSIANGGNSIPYNELELYLMGMIPVSSVKNFDVFASITSFTNNNDGTYSFHANKRKTYTPDSLTALLGERTPSYLTSQKDFKALLIVLTDQPLTTEQWNQINNDAELFSRKSSDGYTGYNFWEATNHLGTLEFGNLNDCLLGTGEIVADNNFGIHTYPNPVKNLLTIEFRGMIHRADRISLWSIVGKKMKTFQINSTVNKISIDLSDLPAGIYFVRFERDNKTFCTRKIIVR